MGDLIVQKTLATTNAYVSMFVLPLSSNIDVFEVYIKETNVNAIKYKILATYDNLAWEEAQAEATVAKNASATVEIVKPWLAIDVQVKDSVAETHGNVRCTVAGS